MHLVDTHCHLQLAAFASDADAVFERAHAKDIGMIVVGTNIQTSRTAIAFAERVQDKVWAAVGIHPGHVHAPHHDKNEFAEPPVEEFFDESIFNELVASNKVVAIGETGLDYYRIIEVGGRTIEEIKIRQQENFRGHIRFADARKLPLIVHVRDAHADVIRILTEEKAPTGVIHCFSGTVTDAEAYLKLGFYISFTATLTYPPRRTLPPHPLPVRQAGNPLLGQERELTEVAKSVPLDRILIETDSPYLAPVSLRGTRNEPQNVVSICEAVAHLRGMSSEEIANKTTENAVRLFNLATPDRS